MKKLIVLGARRPQGTDSCTVMEGGVQRTVGAIFLFTLTCNMARNRHYLAIGSSAPHSLVAAMSKYNWAGTVTFSKTTSAAPDKPTSRRADGPTS